MLRFPHGSVEAFQQEDWRIIDSLLVIHRSHSSARSPNPRPRLRSTSADGL